MFVSHSQRPMTMKGLAWIHSWLRRHDGSLKAGYVCMYSGEHCVESDSYCASITKCAFQNESVVTRVSDSVERCLIDSKWLFLEEAAWQSWQNTLCCDFPDEWREGDAHRQTQTHTHTFYNSFLAFTETASETSESQRTDSLMPTIKLFKNF